jgi:hypothetical protein
VLPRWEGADEAQSRCSFSNLIRYGSGSQFDQRIPGTDKFVWNDRGGKIIAGVGFATGSNDLLHFLDRG